VLLEETNVSMAPSIFTTGEPVTGNRSAPVMVMVAGVAVEFMMALATVGLVAASCAWAAMAETNMAHSTTPEAGWKDTRFFILHFPRLVEISNARNNYCGRGWRISAMLGSPACPNNSG
jgi:hypothetical protein